MVSFNYGDGTCKDVITPEEFKAMLAKAKEEGYREGAKSKEKYKAVAELLKVVVKLLED